jgi:hypothetical protein
VKTRVFRLGGGEYEYGAVRFRSEPQRLFRIPEGRAPQFPQTRESANRDWRIEAASVDHGRYLFFIALAEVEPAVLASLRDGPYRILKASDCALPWVDSCIDDLGPEQRDFLVSVQEWAKRWHLRDKWCLDRAIQILSYWHSLPASVGSKDSLRGSHVRIPFYRVGKRSTPIRVELFKTRPLRFEHQSWDPTHLPWGTYEAFAKSRFLRQLASYREAIEEKAISAGLRKTPEKHGFEHFHWLARYQLGGSLSSIKPAYLSSRQAVWKAIGGLAKYIGLTLRARLPQPRQ